MPYYNMNQVVKLINLTAYAYVLIDLEVVNLVKTARGAFTNECIFLYNN